MFGKIGSEPSINNISNVINNDLKLNLNEKNSSPNYRKIY
jgi:hypothetical protein